ncbi:MAG TPA: hypothetical protein GX010_03990 [Erysipelotrichaceae bacterium]|nr:hypothetical protein [Erysipelotrichaceae bacterium]
MKQSLRKEAFANTKNNIYAKISIGIFCGLALILVAMLSFIDLSYVFLALPIFLFPFLFASYISSYYLLINQPVNITVFFNYFIGFFKPQFIGSFRGLKSLLKSLAIYFISLFISYVVFYLIFKNYYGDPFVEAFTNLVTRFSSAEIGYEDILNLLLDNNSLLLTFFVYIETFAIIPFMLSFIYFTSYSSISIYYRANIVAGAMSVVRLCIANTFRKLRKKMSRDWWLLNWPMIVLSLLGIIVGLLIGIFAVKEVTLLPAFVVVGSVILLIFFLPLYFSNMEVIYKKYENDFKKGNEEAIKFILQRIQSSIDMNVEEKKSIEESLKKEQNDDEIE